MFEALFVAPFLLSAAATHAAVRPAISLAWKLGLIDDPKASTHPKVIHEKATPRGGGLAIFVGIAFASAVFLPMDALLRAILAGAALLTYIGLLDDKYDINPYTRLAMQFFAAGIPIAAGVGIEFFNNPLTGGIVELSGRNSLALLSSALTLFWIVGLMNFINMGAKGVDGQLTGVAAIAATTVALLSLRFSADISEWPVTILAAATAGAFAGFIPWHIYPQKIMPGFGGSNIAGYFLGVVSILSTAKIGLVLIVLGVPLIDTGYTVLRRLLAGKSPVWGDTRHLHHGLLKLGFTKHQVALFYWAAAGLLGAVALAFDTTAKFFTFTGLIFLLGGVILLIARKGK